MNFHRHLLVIILYISISCSCTKDDIKKINLEEALPILMECNDNQLSNEGEIRQNLLGTWTTIAYGCGFCTPLEDDPEVTVTFKTSLGTAVVDGEEIEFSWTLSKEPDIYGESVLTLKTEPVHWALQMTYFCREYMYFDDRPVEGIMLLYQKT